MRAFAGVVTQQNLLHPFPIWLNFFLVGTRETPKNIGKIIILFKVTIIIKCSRLACVWSFQLGTCVFANSPQIAQSNMFCHKTPTGSCPSTTWWHLVSHKLSHLVKNFQRLTMIRTIKNQHIDERTLHLFLRSLFLSSDMRWFQNIDKFTGFKFHTNM